MIQSLAALTNLAVLEQLNLQNAFIESWQDVESILRTCPNLKQVWLNGNPVCGVIKFRQLAIEASGFNLEALNDKQVTKQEKVPFVHFHFSRNS